MAKDAKNNVLIRYRLQLEQWEKEGYDVSEFKLIWQKELYPRKYSSNRPADTPSAGGLVDCPDCGRSVSRRAESCPNCGYPISESAKIYPHRKIQRNVFVLTLICGCLTIVGVFLRWATLKGGLLHFPSGWQWLDSSLGNAAPIYMVFIGGIVMAVFSVTAPIVSSKAEYRKSNILVLYVLAIIGPLVAFVGCVYFQIDNMSNEIMVRLGNGFWISFAAAIVGFISPILAAVYSIIKKSS